MNILYLGPYRLNTTDGYDSLNTLLTLSTNKTNNIIARPIFLNNQTSDINNNIPKNIRPLEQKQGDHIDMIIQHTDIDSAVYTSDIKYQLLWVLNNKLLPQTYQKLKYKFLHDKIGFITSNKYSSACLYNAEIINNTFYMRNPYNSSMNEQPTTGIFDFGLYNRYIKYYTIVGEDMLDEISDIVVQFIRKFQQDSACLLVFMTNINQSVLDKYNNLISQIYKNLKIHHTINKIIIVPIEPSINAIDTAHTTGDIYISLEDNIYHTIAQYKNKMIIHNQSEMYLGYSIKNLSPETTILYKTPLDINNFEQNTRRSSTSLELNINQIVDSYVKSFNK